MARVANPAVEAWLHEFALAGLRPEEVDAFVGTVDREILAAIPEVAADRTLVEQLHASTRAHWRTFLVGLSDEYRLSLPPAAIALSLSIARRHLDLSVLLKVYRVANKSTFRYLAEKSTQPDMLPPGLPRDEALLALWERAEAWIDDSVESLILHFTQERAALTEGAHARRGEIIESLIAGSEPNATTERMLGHKLALWQTAFVLSSSSPDTGEMTPFYDVAVKVCSALGLPQPLTTLAASRELWGWVATPEAPDLVVEAAAELMGEQGLHLALSRPCRGTTAFRTSHLQAVAAQRVGQRAGGPCHAYADVELVGLLGDGELAQDMIRRELGPLLGSARGMDTLRATALAFLRCGQSVDAAAERLFVHPNTVRYRIARTEELLGHRVAANAAVLEAGLSWLEVYGTDRLPAAE